MKKIILTVLFILTALSANAQLSYKPMGQKWEVTFTLGEYVFNTIGFGYDKPDILGGMMTPNVYYEDEVIDFIKANKAKIEEKYDVVILSASRFMLEVYDRTFYEEYEAEKRAKEAKRRADKERRIASLENLLD